MASGEHRLCQVTHPPNPQASSPVGLRLLIPTPYLTPWPGGASDGDAIRRQPARKAPGCPERGGSSHVALLSEHGLATCHLKPACGN